MTNKFLNDIDFSETVEDSENQTTSPYQLTSELLDKGFDFDNSAIYVPYTFKYEENADTRDIYLKIERIPNQKTNFMIYSWTSLEKGQYRILNSFRRDILLTEEDIDSASKSSINRKLSHLGRIARLNATEGSYKGFFESLLIDIVNSSCLDIFKVLDYDFSMFDEDTEEEDFADENFDINSFEDYSEDIQKEATKLLKNGKLFEELQNSVSLTHQGHNMTRDSLILQETSVFVGDGVHGLLDGDSGEGKSDLAFAIGYNFPSRYVKILRNVSPKNIYYDCENYNDDFNILIFDDLPLTDDMINILKELADNTKKVKELKTVIKGKAVKFTLKGKFIVILTYAKTIEDGELANRLYNVGVNIVDKSKGKSLVKHKIRDNSVIGGNFNPIIERVRLIIQASIHNLIEKNIKVFNPFSTIFNPTDYNNRDVNHFVHMMNAKTFFNYYQRKQIQINDELTITIGSFEDFTFVNKIWSEDSEAQKLKLSEQQKKILNILPYQTQDEAFEYVEQLTNEYNNIQSRKAKNKLLDNEPTKKTITRSLKINQNTLTNLLDKSHENSTTKSLIELGVVEKIQLEDITYKPNYYYKIKKEGNALISAKKSIEAIEIQFQETFSDSLVKQKIIIDLLYICNIVLNEIGFKFLKKYCDEYDEEINLKDYNSYFNMINSFFEGLNHDKMCVKLENASLDELTSFNDFKEEIGNQIHKKYNDNVLKDDEFFQQTSKKKENSSNDVKHQKTLLKSKSNRNNRLSKANQDFLKEKKIDSSIAFSVYDVLVGNEKTFEEIRLAICENLNPLDVDSHHLALKLEMNFNRLKDNDLIDIVSYSNKAEHYAVNEKFSEVVGDEQ